MSNISHSVQEAEEAVSKAQSYSSTQSMQDADQKLKIAYQQVHDAEHLIDSEDLQQLKNLHKAKEYLRNLQENQDSLHIE